jgi:hypothetical protein
MDTTKRAPRSPTACSTHEVEYGEKEGYPVKISSTGTWAGIRAKEHWEQRAEPQ